MPGHPIDTASRVARRAEIRRHILARAEQEIARTGRSIVCGHDNQHETCSGAANCLCECHDQPKEA